MIWNEHWNLIGKHAFLSPSNYHWLRYSPEKLQNYWLNDQAKQRGTELHELAAKLIQFNQKLPRSHRTLNMYVNDAIGFRMTPEQPLYYSSNCFGTADTICCRRNDLRIHDLKTGSTPASMDQLKIYAGLFFLEYKKNVKDFNIELRIYQNDDILVCNPEVDEIVEVMEQIVLADKVLEEVKQQEG